MGSTECMTCMVLYCSMFTGTKWLEIHHFFFTEFLPCTLKCYATFRPTFKFSELHWISFAFHFHKQDFLSHNKVKTQANFEFFDQIGRILTMIFPKLSATEVGHLQCVTCIDKCFNKHMRVNLWSWHSTSDDQILSCLSWSAFPSWNNNTRFIWWCL